MPCLCTYSAQLIGLMAACLVALQQVLSIPVVNHRDERQDNPKLLGFGDPVWSHGESGSSASASGDGSAVFTDSWTSVDNHGGLQVNNITSNGTLIGYQVQGLTNCSQESWAHAVGGSSANAVAYGLCNSSVQVNEPVSNTGVGAKIENDGH